MFENKQFLKIWCYLEVVCNIMTMLPAYVFATSKNNVIQHCIYVVFAGNAFCNSKY